MTSVYRVGWLKVDDIANRPAAILQCQDVFNAFLPAGLVAMPLNAPDVHPLGEKITTWPYTYSISRSSPAVLIPVVAIASIK